MRLAILLILCSLQAFPQLRKQPNFAFNKGEILVFRIHYGIIDAGIATLEVINEEKKFGPREVYHVVGTGITNEFFDVFFKVRDRYETYIDMEAIVPWLFIRRVDEGGYKINQNVVFNQHKDEVKSSGGSFKVPDNIQDLLSTYYYLRTLDFSKCKVGDTFKQEAFLDDEIHKFAYKYLGKETVTTSLGTFRCLKFCPTLLKGRVFKSEEDMVVWITDDLNKIPIRAEARILVGSVKLDLKEYAGIRNPISELLTK